MNDKNTIWGSVIVPAPDQSKDAGHILGALVEFDNGQPAFVKVHAKRDGKPYEMRYKFGDAMFLLSVLKSIQLDTETPFPDDPRAPSAR